MRTTRTSWAGVFFLCLFTVRAASSGEHETGAPEPTADALVAAIPFEKNANDGRIVIDLAPDGHRPLTMLLDTGATASIVTPRYARSLGVSPRKVRDREVQRATRLGRDLLFWVDTRRSDTAAPGSFEFGVVGGTFLRNYVVELDFESRIVRFFDPDRYAVPERVDDPAVSIVAMKLRANRPFVELKIRGKPVTVLLDTGLALPVVLSGDASRKVGLNLEASAPDGRITIPFGSTELVQAGLERVELGGFAMDAVPIAVAEKGLFNQAGPMDAILGTGLLQAFKVRLDYPRRRIWLQRRAKQASPTPQ